MLFAKLVPERIESSLYAFSTGLMNLASLFIAPNLGNLINVIFFHVNLSNLTYVWALYATQAVMAVIPVLFVWLLPTR